MQTYLSINFTLAWGGICNVMLIICFGIMQALGKWCAYTIPMMHLPLKVTDGAENDKTGWDVFCFFLTGSAIFFSVSCIE